MATKLQDSEISQHIEDLADINNGMLVPSFAEGCVQRFVRTFADTQMRYNYERLWKAFPCNPEEN